MKRRYALFIGLCILLIAFFAFGLRLVDLGFLAHTQSDFADLYSWSSVGFVVLGVTLLVVSIKLKESRLLLEQNITALEYANRATLSVLQDLRKEKEQVAAAKAKDEAILAGIGDGVFVLDTKGNIILFNQAAEKISGYSAAETIGKPYKEILIFRKEEGAAPGDEFIKEALQGKKAKMAHPTVLRRKDARDVPVADSAAPVLDRRGVVQGVVVVFRDITEERQISAAKTEFVSLASHQLRTPPTIVNYYAEMLLTGDAGKITPKQQEFISEIYSASKRMSELVSGLLNVTRLDLGTFVIEPTPVRVGEVIRSALKDLTLQIKEKKITIRESCDDDLVIQNDRKLLLVIMQNLLTNSLKYTPTKGLIEIKVQKTENSVRIIVKDNGCGIPKEAQAKIFEKMYRAPNAQNIDPQGTGLGLYIIKSILVYMGGKTWFESEEGKGTTFYVELPRTRLAPRAGTTRIS